MFFFNLGFVAIRFNSLQVLSQYIYITYVYTNKNIYTICADLNFFSYTFLTHLSLQFKNIKAINVQLIL